MAKPERRGLPESLASGPLCPRVGAGPPGAKSPSGPGGWQGPRPRGCEQVLPLEGTSQGDTIKNAQATK